MKLPCYEKLTKYNFHDVLTALVKNCFAIQHRKSMILREKRLKDARESGVPLSKWETMHEDSPAFHALTITEQEKFLDETCNSFRSVVDRIEEKGMREGKDQIYELHLMKKIRRKVDQPYRGLLDKFSDGHHTTIFDSSHLYGGAVIQKYIRGWQARKSGLVEPDSAGLSSKFG